MSTLLDRFKERAQPPSYSRVGLESLFVEQALWPLINALRAGGIKTEEDMRYVLGDLAEVVSGSPTSKWIEVNILSQTSEKSIG